MTYAHHKWIVSTAILQGALMAALAIIFLLILPSQGFRVMNDFDSAEKVGSQGFWMDFIRWTDFIFAVSMLVVLAALYRQVKWPYVVRSSVFIVLFGAVVWLILHDLGFHIINWSDIESDPASTNYAMDRTLWGIRNVIFFVVSVLTALSAKRR